MGAGIQRGGEREEEKEWDGKREKERETAAGRGWRGGKGEDGGGVGGVKMKALMIYEMGREIRGAGVGGCGRR